MDDKCEMCGATLYSITTRRAGDHQFCRDCGGIVLPLIEACANVHCETLIRMYKDVGPALTRQHSEEMTAELLGK